MTTTSPGALSRHDRQSGSAQAPARNRWKTSGPAWRAAPLAFALVAATTGTRAATLQDSFGRSIDVPAAVHAVVPAGPPAQVLLHALAPDKLAGLVEPFRPQQIVYVDAGLRDLPQIPMLARTSAPGDVAMVAELKPDLVVDYGNASKRYAAADDKIQKQLGVPAALFGGGLAEAPHVVRTLGSAIGEGAHAEILAATIEDVLGRLKPLADLPDTERIAVLVSRGADGLTAARSGTSFDEPIRLAGGRNVVEGGAGTFKRLSIEEIVALNPTVVVVADRDALSSPLHAALPKGTRFVLDQGEPYQVLTGPPRSTGL